MTCVILIAHGSRELKANQEIATLAEQLAAEKKTNDVRFAFLDRIASPNIPETIDSAIADGATRIIALPYFLNSGIHVQKDIPTIIEQKKKQYPHVVFELRSHLGANPKMIDLLRS